MQDVVTILLLPLYFINGRLSWIYVTTLLMLAFVGKVVGTLLAAHAYNLSWKDSFVVGVLISSKVL